MRTWAVPAEPPGTLCRVKASLSERGQGGGWGKPSSASRCTCSEVPQKKRYCSRWRSVLFEAADLSSSSLASSLSQDTTELLVDRLCRWSSCAKAEVVPSRGQQYFLFCIGFCHGNHSRH